MGTRRRDVNRTSIGKKSTTDPDATLYYRPGQGSHLSYKAHIAKGTNGIFSAVSASPSSLHYIDAVHDLIESYEKILGVPDWVAADIKYRYQECLKYLQDNVIKTAIKPETKINKPGYFSRDKFIYDRQRDCYICPNGKVLKRKTKNYSHNRIVYKSNKKDCKICPLKEKCISGKESFRTVSHYDSHCYSKALGWYYSGHGKALYKLRGTVIEGIFGQAKSYHDMARARFRGLKNVEIQFLMTASALNLKKMVKILDAQEIKSIISNKTSAVLQSIK